MAKIIMMRGLPASGKTTKAKEIVAGGGNFVRVNKDLLREMLHFGRFTGRNEGTTIKVEIALVKSLVVLGYNVIVDDTNLGDKHLQRWKGIADAVEARFEMCEMMTPCQECMARDEARSNSVGHHVIYQMAMESGLLPSTAFTICDIDGTLADLTHRLGFLYTNLVDEYNKLIPREKKDWEGFFAAADGDRFKTEVWDQVKPFTPDVVLVSARPEKYRASTVAWLSKNGVIQNDGYRTLIMRRDGDRRDDDIVKKEILDRYFRYYKVERVFDDRPRVIRMWRENGLNVVDVGNGLEF